MILWDSEPDEKFGWDSLHARRALDIVLLGARLVRKFGSAMYFFARLLGFVWYGLGYGYGYDLGRYRYSCRYRYGHMVWVRLWRMATAKMWMIS